MKCSNRERSALRNAQRSQEARQNRSGQGAPRPQIIHTRHQPHKAWLRLLAAELWERLEEDQVQNRRRATKLILYVRAPISELLSQ